jgi:hypothetical protein
VPSEGQGCDNVWAGWAFSTPEGGDGGVQSYGGTMISKGKPVSATVVTTDSTWSDLELKHLCLLQ